MILYGASGHAKVVIDTLKICGIETIFLIDDDLENAELFGYKVNHNYNEIDYSEDQCIVTIGNNSTRFKIVSKIKHQFGKVIHPTSYISSNSIVNEGSVVFANSVIQPSSVIGKHCIINTKASVDHDCTIGDFAHIGPGVTICGEVKIGLGTFIGAGAIVLPGVIIGDWVMVGAGAVVTRNIPHGETWVGNPAHMIKSKYYGR